MCAELLTGALGMQSAGKLAQAEEAVQEAETALLGDRAQVVRAVDAGTAAALLGDPRQIFALARLCEAQADFANRRGDVDAGAGLARRALELALEASSRDQVEGEALRLVRKLASRTDATSLSTARRQQLEKMKERWNEEPKG